MSLEELLSRLIPALERAQVVYMLTGSVASSAHGMPRSTRDLDIVIAPTPAQLKALIKAFPGDRYYADEQQALLALANRSQFNVIDFATGWKTDFIIAQDSAYGHSALGRRTLIDIAGTQVYVARRAYRKTAVGGVRSIEAATAGCGRNHYNAGKQA